MIMVNMTLSDSEISKKIKNLRKTNGHIYAPLKYFRGLDTTRDVEKRYRKMLKKNYQNFETDKGIKTKTSSYTKKFREKYPKAKSLRDISKATKIPIRILQTVYNRGLAAWRTGHRPGATPQAWGYARVHSYVMKGKTYHTANKNLHSK